MGREKDEQMNAPIHPDAIPGTGGLKPLTVPVKTACEISGLGVTSIYELMNAGKLQSTTIGRRRLIIYSSLEALLAPAAAE